MAEGLQEKQSQTSIQPQEMKIPKEVLMSQKYQTEKGQLDQKNQALKALACIPCTSQDVENRDKFIKYIEMHEQAVQIYTIINSLPQGELSDCFDSTFGTSFIDACNSQFIDSFCKKTTEEIVAVKEEKIAIKEEREIERKNEIKNTKILSDIQKKLTTHKELNQKDIVTINTKNPSSPEFQQATKNILAELKIQAQKSGDFQEYRSFLDNFHSIGAISNEELLNFKKELDGFKSSSNDGKDNKSNTSDAFGKDLRNHEYEKIGDSYIRFGRLGEQTDEIVRIDEKSGEASKRIVSSKSGYAREIVFSKTPTLDRDVKIGEINEKLSGVENKLTKITEYKKEQKILESTPNRTEKEKNRLKELKSLNIDPESVIEAKLKEEKVRLESEKGELPQIEGGSQELQVKQEKDARETIQFIDDMGLYMLGVENVDKFFDILNIGSSNGKIDISNGLDKAEKAKIKQAFIELLGQDIFEPNSSCRLRQGKTAQDIKKLLIEKKIYKEGEVPPVKFTDLKTAMTKNNA